MIMLAIKMRVDGGGEIKVERVKWLSPKSRIYAKSKKEQSPDDWLF